MEKVITRGKEETKEKGREEEIDNNVKRERERELD